MIGDDRDSTERQSAEGENADNIDNVDNASLRKRKRKQMICEPSECYRRKITSDNIDNVSKKNAMKTGT